MVRNKLDQSYCMKRILDSVNYEKFTSLCPKQQLFFENLCIQSFNDIYVLFDDCIKLNEQKENDK